MPAINRNRKYAHIKSKVSAQLAKPVPAVTPDPKTWKRPSLIAAGMPINKSMPDLSKVSVKIDNKIDAKFLEHVPKEDMHFVTRSASKMSLAIADVPSARTRGFARYKSSVELQAISRC